MSGIDQDTQNASAGRLDQAETRLAQALGRLEAALDVREQAWTQAQADTQAQSQPDPALTVEIERLKAENGELRALVGEAYARVDGAIGKLKAQMEG